MSSHGHGKGMRSVSTSIPVAAHTALVKRAKDGHWRSLGAYLRAVLEHHVAQRQAIAQRRTLYEITAGPPAHAAESPGDYDPLGLPIAPVCPLVRPAPANRGNGEGVPV